MNKKADTQYLDIPEDDIECWEKYTKHRWVYELTRLLDSQNIKWSPYETNIFNKRELALHLFSNKPLLRQPGFIWVKEPEGDVIITEIYIIKGEIKYMRHVDNDTGVEVDRIIGEIELRLNAFVTLYFQKFTGVISVETHSNEIYHISLRPNRELSEEKNSEVIKLLKRIYKKNDITINGLSDQALHEKLTS
jgi:hypothetical protein